MQLKRVVLVQFYLHEIVDIELDGHTAFLGPNGSGKSSTLDAIQIAMLGGNLQYAQFNTQSVSSKKKRTISSYCLGLLRNPENDSQMIGRARDQSRTYIVLVFGDEKTGAVLSSGLCVEASIHSDEHDIKGLFVLPGQELRAADCIQTRDDKQTPIAFADFREARRVQAKDIGRTAIFTSKSTEYVTELMYALNGRKMPDARRFMSSFVKSMTLKNVDSIDQFVRDYVVEPNPVDVAGFRRQVEQFRALTEMVKRILSQIGELGKITEEYRTAELAERRIAMLTAIKAIFAMEKHAEEMDELEERIGLLEGQAKEAKGLIQEADAKRQQLQDTANQMKVNLGLDSVDQARLLAEERIQRHQQTVENFGRPEISRARKVMIALSELQSDKDFNLIEGAVEKCFKRLEVALQAAEPSAAVSLQFQALKPHLDTIASFAEERRAEAQRQRAKLVEEIGGAKARIAAAARTGRDMGDGAANLLDLLHSVPMEAKPVSALASFVDPSWAPALEAYLGNDRDALVVLQGDTRLAVRILRQARQRGDRIDGAAVVQPHHLRDVDTRSRGQEFAVGMFGTTNDTARRFLWNRFGSMRLVETEAQLEEYPRALTKDGMLSQGGLTKSIGVVPRSDLRIGRDHFDAAGLTKHMADIDAEIAAIDKRIKLVEALARSLDREVANDKDQAAQIEKANKEIQENKKILASLDLAQSDALRQQIKDAEEQANSAQDEHTRLVKIAAGLEQQSDTASKSLTELRGLTDKLRQDQADAMSSPLVNAEEMDKLKSEIEIEHLTYDARINNIDVARIKSNQDRLNRAVERGNNALSQYVHETRVDLQWASMAWHERYLWCVDEKRRLTDVDLHRYETEAEAARQASEDTLRSDVAMSLHDRFQEMELERRDRNRILENCPPFTGGERYKFVYAVVPEYETLVRYINQIAKDGTTLSLIGDDSEELDATLRKLIEAAAEGPTSAAVLDYRQFFTFDLDILVDGTRVDRMSTRQGAGSNGEHIGPMYVSAGAALAKAYRTDARKGQSGQQGFGLICLDEAFHGMDTTNALATARFLSSIGLQLIMAGPELERTKLAPVATTIYDLDREGLDLLMERTDLTARANTLMVSDMPSENPEVMKRAYQQLGMDPAQASTASVRSTPADVA